MIPWEAVLYTDFNTLHIELEEILMIGSPLAIHIPHLGYRRP